MKRKKRIRNTFYLVTLSLCALVLFYRSRTAVTGCIEHCASYLVFPFLKLQMELVHIAGVSSSEWIHVWKREKEYKQIVVERDDLRAQLIALQAEAAVKEETKELQAFSEQYQDYSVRLVRILEKQYQQDDHFFLIEGGVNQGIKKDTAVVYKNCLVGRISEVFPWYSKVTLITDACCKVASYCQQTKTPGIYCGSYSLQEGLLAHVGHLATVQEGDTIFSSGQGLVFPKGFGIGTITSFSKNEGDMQYTIAVKPFVDFNAIAYCFVLEQGLEKTV